MHSILEICQEAASLVATQKPNDLFDEDSQQEAVFLSIAKDTLDSLLRYGDWQELTKEGVLRTAGKKTSYLLTAICPDFYSILNNTIYIKDSAERVIGAITPQDWMREKYFNCPSADVRFKIQNGMIKFLTPPPDGIKIVFQYRSSTIVFDAANGYEEKSEITKNTDVPVFDEFLVKKGIVWRWYKRNGMDYTEEYNEYEREVKVKFGAGLATQDIDLSGGYFDPVEAGVYVNAAKAN